MSNIKFKTTERIERPIMRIIHAMTDNPGRILTIYLDKETGNPMYPMRIEQIIPGITITLDSDTKVTCSFPPSVPEKMINSIIEYLNMFDDTVSAARELIKEEQQLLKNTRNK